MSKKTKASLTASSDVKGKQRAVETPAKAKKPEKIKLRRVHVSGLPAGLSEEDVKNRFKTFGEVKSVDNLGKIDGNGHPLRYAFLDIECTKSKLAQCMNLLSGSVWKGSTLRIAEAKPTFTERLARERQQEASKKQASESSIPEVDSMPAVPIGTVSGSKKRKRAEGVESKNQGLVDSAAAKTREGWKVDPKSGTPIFPIVARPDHPLPPLPEASSSSKATKSAKLPASKANKDDKKALAKEKKKEKKARAAAEAAATAESPNRAHRVKIDPTKWKPTHLREEDMPRGSGRRAEISLEEPQTGEMPSSASSDEEQVSEDEEALANGDAHAETPAANESGSEPDQKDGTPSSEGEAEQEDKDRDTATAEGPSERKAQMALLAKVLGRAPERISPPPSEAAALPESESSSEEDEDEEEAEGPQVVPAAEAAFGLAAEEVDSEEDVSSEEDEADADSAMSEDESGTASKPADPPSIQMNSLTEMFKPQEAGLGFMLGDLLDEGEFDLEELPSEPTALTQPSFRPQAQMHAPQPRHAGTRAGAFDPHEQLFFPFPIEEDELPGGVAYGLTETQREALLARSWTGVSEFKRFKRTQNMEEITAQYEMVRKTLNEQVRKRHREAVKTRKRNGGKRSKGLFAHDDE